ncbi:MAG: alpha/beta fold hydrolase [Pseudomonadota bacterium]
MGLAGAAVRAAAGALTGAALAALGFVLWSALLLPFPPCSLLAGPCDLALGRYSAELPVGVARPIPAVLYLHGSKGAGSSFIADKALIATAKRRGFAVLAPDGLDMSYSSGVFSGWGLANSPGPGRDELAFLTEVLADAEKRLGIDPGRVLLLGHSRGGFLVWELACRAPDLATGFAAVSATFWGALPRECQAGEVALLHLHGLGDQAVPIEGRINADGTVLMTPAEASLALFRQTGGCAGAEEVTRALPQGGTWRGWPGCGAGLALAQARLPGGHGFNRRRFALALDWFTELISD